MKKIIFFPTITLMTMNSRCSIILLHAVHLLLASTPTDARTAVTLLSTTIPVAIVTVLPVSATQERNGSTNSADSFLTFRITTSSLLYPDTLNDIFMNNKEKMYNLLFKTSSQTLLQASERLYGQIGFTSILHTWGQNLWFHPHVHMIVSGGGLSHGENGEFTFKKAPANFLFQ